MSVAEETIKNVAPSAAAVQSRTAKKPQPFLNRALNLISSVRFGVSLLIVMVLFSLVGMLIVQQNVEGFENFYAAMTPAEKLIYENLGFFDIYHTWYFNALLLLLSLNIVLASIDHFPKAWTYVAKPKIEATKAYLLNQKFKTQFETAGGQKAVTENVTAAFKKFRFNPRVTNKDNGRVILFGQKNVFNRLGAYVVHVALLTLFLGHFVALQTGYDADVRMLPGQTENKIQLIQYKLDSQARTPVQLPFTLYCSDIEQKLIKQDGSIEINNTLDWFTRLTIDDPTYGKRDVSISLNQPYTYRGYRFFQASAVTIGSARNMSLQLTPVNGGEPLKINLMRNSATTLPDGTIVKYQAFFADFFLNGSKPDNRSGDYNNPAVRILVTKPDGEFKDAYAFAANLPSSAPIGAPIFGYKYKLVDYEKSPLAHVLSIKYDPYYGSTIAWYWGGGLLMLALCGVFFLGHQRIWAIIEPNGTVTMGGHANRNELGFGDKFQKIAAEIKD